MYNIGCVLFVSVSVLVLQYTPQQYAAEIWELLSTVQKKCILSSRVLQNKEK